MNLRKVIAGMLGVFLAFLLPVLCYGFGVLATAIRGAGMMAAGGMLGQKRPFHAFMQHCPWPVWVYSVAMVLLGLHLVSSGLGEEPSNKS
jgi:hypothetical protein